MGSTGVSWTVLGGGQSVLHGLDLSQVAATVGWIRRAPGVVPSLPPSPGRPLPAGAAKGGGYDHGSQEQRSVGHRGKGWGVAAGTNHARPHTFPRALHPVGIAQKQPRAAEACRRMPRPAMWGQCGWRVWSMPLGRVNIAPGAISIPPPPPPCMPLY